MASCVCDDWPIEKRIRKPHQGFLEHRAVAEELDELLGTASREAGHSRGSRPLAAVPIICCWRIDHWFGSSL